MARIKFGAHENIPLVYHGVGALMTITQWKTEQNKQLHMSKLNDSQKLLTKESTLEDHKQWVLAITSVSCSHGQTIFFSYAFYLAMV